jgi:hypothetical protein
MYADPSHLLWIDNFLLYTFHMFISQSVKLISDNIWIGLVLWHRLNVYNKKLSIHNKWLGSAYINDYEKYTKERFYLLNYLHVLRGKFDLTNVNNMAFYISGPKLLFEITEISTHPNSTQQGSNYIYSYFSYISCYILWNDNDACFVLNPHAELDCYINQWLWKIHNGSVLSIELFVRN